MAQFTTFRDAFERTLRLSPFARRTLAARPGLESAVADWHATPIDTGWMRSQLRPGEGLEESIRSLRAAVMLGLAHRDLNGLAPLAEVLDTATALADVCIEAAAVEAARRTEGLHGAAQGNDALAVVALGKLGGRELNVSSDIDLVFLHAGEGSTAGPKVVSHHEFFAAVGRCLIALLSEVTAHGPAFRVDMRLRPFGISGPPVTSFQALEDYFIAHARPWERYAWMKARVVAGPATPVEALVEPFVYRRYLDYGMLESLRELHGRIAEAARERRKVDDIKVGTGGIREAEFAVQLIQLVRGGRDAGLRTASTRAALAAIAERGLMEPQRARALGAAYEYLRRLEHRLQYYDDQQTQALPREEEHRAAIAEAMGARDYGHLLEELDRQRLAVQEAFDALFQKEARAPQATVRLGASLFDPQAAPEPEALAEALEAVGISEPAPVAARLTEFVRSRRLRGLSAACRAKVERLVPEVVAVAGALGAGAALIGRLVDLLEAIGGREAYFALLLENSAVLKRAAHLMGRSAWAARLLARHPILLDELTRAASTFVATDWPSERDALAAECAALEADVEGLLDHLRHFKQRHVLRLTIADIEGELPVMALSDELSALADAILDVTIDEAAVNVGFERAERGKGPAWAPVLPGFCAVGYGKLGGKELGYGSDLDVIFLYDEGSAGEADRLARVAQRVNSWMTALTPAGVLYETDLRLRPDGAKGLMVSALAAFREYELTRAWTWEHQALTRARACAGDRALGERFERVRDEILAAPRDRQKLFADIVSMRARMRTEHRREAGELKHAEGGVIDLEFCVQALVLLHGPAHAQLRENKGNHTLLKRAGELGLIDKALAVEAADAYLAMRRRTHDAALNDEEAVKLAPGELEAERAAVKRLWSEVFGEPKG
jgi:glutamate-ammonia-ligase adenylyltransferase